MNVCRPMIAALLLVTLWPAVSEARPVTIARKRVTVERRSVPVILIRADLKDPKTLVSMRFAHGGRPQQRRLESFAATTKQAHAAAVVSGTFFSVKNFETLGNAVVAGRLIQHRDWDTRGTSLTLAQDGRARIRTLRAEGRPDYESAWLSFAAGPRLLKDGKVWLRPWFEGFRDPALFGRHARMAAGLTRDGRQLVFATFPNPLTLQEEAEAMRQLGFHDALNLDGGPSVGMAYRGKIVKRPHWGLTNTLVVYDLQHPAPASLRRAFRIAAER